MLSHCHPATVLHASLLRPTPNPNSIHTLPLFHFPALSSPKPLLFSSSSSSSSSSSRAFATTHTPQYSDAAESSRLQNPASTALLLLHHSQSTSQDGISLDHEEAEEEELQKRKIADEYSLATRMTPRFPGSIDFPRPERMVTTTDLQRVLDSDDRVLKRALQVRRGVSAETLKDALRSGKFSINYSANLVSLLSEFVDLVVIEAAAMKADLEFAHLTFNARAKSYIQRSGVVALVKWLKHNHLTYPQIGKIICLCRGDLQLVRQVAEWLKSIHVKGESLGVVLVKAGPIWDRSLDVLQQIVDYLEQNGVRRDWMGFVVGRCPQLLAITMEELETRVKFYLDMGMSKNDFGTMVYDYPRVLGFFSFEEMANKVQYLKEFGLSTEDVGRLLAFKPQLMGCSIEERWKPLVKYLYYLGVQRDGMKRILVVKPMVFCVDLETTISPKVRFLQDIGVRGEAIGAVLVKFPSLLTYSLYKKIRPVVIFLMTKAGVSQNNIGKVIALDPQLIGCSIIKKLDINVKYFLSLGIRLKSLGVMIADFPMLLRYNIEVLRPKYRYLRQIMVRPLEDLIEFPRFFSYSLDDRIVPRHKILLENRVNFKLRYMLAGSDEEFNQRVQAAIEKRKRFESGNSSIERSDDADQGLVPSLPG